MDVRKVYEYALQREHEGMNFFRQNAQRFGHATVVDAFEKMADEERKHINFIQSLIDALDKERVTGLAKGEELAAEGFFSQRAESDGFGSL